MNNLVEEIYYFKSILRQLRSLRGFVQEHEIGPSTGQEVLSDNIDWLDCHIDRLEKSEELNEEYQAGGK